MPGTSLKKRAMRLLVANPGMSARDLQEALHCSKTTAYQLIRIFRASKSPAADERPPAPVLRLIQKGRTPAEDLPPATQDLVVDELVGLMELVRVLRTRAVEEKEKLRPIEHSQLANAIGNVTKSIQTLCDTYPGLAQLTTQKAQSTVGLQDSDLADCNNWLAG